MNINKEHIFSVYVNTFQKQEAIFFLKQLLSNIAVDVKQRARMKLPWEV